MRLTGLEPARDPPLEPKSSASANSAITASIDIITEKITSCQTQSCFSTSMALLSPFGSIIEQYPRSSLKPQKPPDSLHLFLCHTISVPIGSLQLLYIALKTVQKIIWAQDHNLSLPLPLLTEAHDLIVAVRPGQDRLPDSGVLVGKDPRPQLVVFSKTFEIGRASCRERV